MRKNIILTALTMTMISSVTLTACTKAEAKDGETKAETKVETLAADTTSWDGTTLPLYPTGDPTKLTILKYIIPAHTSLATHFHPIMSFGYMIQGELTVVDDKGNSKTFHEGETVVETVKTWHHGENNGDKDVILVVSYAGTTKTPLVVKEGEGVPEDY